MLAPTFWTSSAFNEPLTFRNFANHNNQNDQITNSPAREKSRARYGISQRRFDSAMVALERSCKMKLRGEIPESKSQNALMLDHFKRWPKYRLWNMVGMVVLVLLVNKF